jgi:hypothetical protein
MLSVRTYGVERSETWNKLLSMFKLYLIGGDALKRRAEAVYRRGQETIRSECHRAPPFAKALVCSHERRIECSFCTVVCPFR